MSRTYKATGINLKSIPLGESDRILTILTREWGLIRAVAPGVRQPKSKLGGRAGLFVVNELVLTQGRSLDRITQAETLESYPGLSKDLGKLTAGQYLAELALCQALSDQPQEELFSLLSEHLTRIEGLLITGDRPSTTQVLPLLTQGIYHLLALGGIAPQVHACCLTQRPLNPDFQSLNWRVGFSISAGGTVSLSPENSPSNSGNTGLKPELNHRSSASVQAPTLPRKVDRQLNAVELAILQQLTAAELPQETHLNLQIQGMMGERPSVDQVWVSIEHLLRHYAQYHYGQSIRSATLMDTYIHSSRASF
ncbi:DNA repair protein RecO [Laspinema olomoucense]|uniref:DNA repair protein RecO n=1 Tax=Laspinema olomoucense TaxID=3231600 RepID=UPI0021BAF2F4|nr:MULTISPECIES: DNA repair protein RecO [unclassified Laspinema]MCT7987332.1 DNA repair protein RecO [Laspinema sp. D3a]MCT7992102.1 DNA repair protein RecO [Laspinema sp. D3c]